MSCHNVLSTSKSAKKGRGWNLRGGSRTNDIHSDTKCHDSFSDPIHVDFVTFLILNQTSAIFSESDQSNIGCVFEIPKMNSESNQEPKDEGRDRTECCVVNVGKQQRDSDVTGELDGLLVKILNNLHCDCKKMSEINTSLKVLSHTGQTWMTNEHFRQK